MIAVSVTSSFNWTLSDTLSAVGILLSLVGFAVTLYQVKKVKRAATAATDAATVMQDRLARNHLLLLLPQLDRIDNDIADAASANNLDLMTHHLSSWRWQASVLRTLLSQVSVSQPETLRKLQDSIVACSSAKLNSKRTSSLSTATKHVRVATAEVVNDLGSLATLISTSEVVSG